MNRLGFRPYILIAPTSADIRSSRILEVSSSSGEGSPTIRESAKKYDANYLFLKEPWWYAHQMPANRTLHYRPDIDGLRAVAVVLVLAYHSRFPVPGGFMGVDVFFVISGFVITESITKSHFSFANFYARRARRLFPALALVLGVSLIAGCLFLTPKQLEELGRQTAATVLFVPNLLFWSESGYFDAASTTKPLLHLWSLGVEEQFYFVWPALLIASAKYGQRTAWVLFGIIVLSLGYSVHLVNTDQIAAFYSPFSRAWELAAGAMVALIGYRNIGRSAPSLANAGFCAGLGTIAISAFHLKNGGHFPGFAALPAVAGSVAIVYFGATSTFAQLALGNRVMVGLGKVSYPLYLWHWPILVFAYLTNGAPLSSLASSIALLVSLALAVLTHRIVELPFRTAETVPRVALIASTILATVGASGGGFLLSRGLPSRLPPNLQDALSYEHYDFKTDGLYPGCWLGNDVSFSKMASVCFQVGRKDSVAIWGDSYAARLTAGLRLVIGADRVSQLTRNGCPPLLDTKADGCRIGNADVLQWINEHPPQSLILFANWQSYGDWAPKSSEALSLVRTLEQIKATGVSDIIVVGPAPRFDPTLPSLLFQRWVLTRAGELPGRLELDGLDVTRNISENISLIANSQGMGFVSLLNLFCNDQGCLTKLPSSKYDLVTWDYGHFTTSAASFSARDIFQFERSQPLR
jgi:peptidoglycan/LPS O-acetylase OafA/YrhL